MSMSFGRVSLIPLGRSWIFCQVLLYKLTFHEWEAAKEVVGGGIFWVWLLEGRTYVGACTWADFICRDWCVRCWLGGWIAFQLSTYLLVSQGPSEWVPRVHRGWLLNWLTSATVLWLDLSHPWVPACLCNIPWICLCQTLLCILRCKIFELIQEMSVWVLVQYGPQSWCLAVMICWGCMCALTWWFFHSLVWSWLDTRRVVCLLL